MGYKSIQNYLKGNYGKFLSQINANLTDPTYTWLNMSIYNAFIKTDSLNREYLLCISFTQEISGIVSFKLNKYFELGAITLVESFA